MSKPAGKLEWVDIDRVVPNDYNPNVMDERMIARERRSLELLGIVRSVVVRETAGVFEIIDGYHRWLLFKEKGFPQIPVRNLGKVSRTRAMAMGQALNGIHGKADFFKLASLYAGISEYSVEQMAELLPHTVDEINAMIDATKCDWGGYDFSEEPEPSGYVTLICRIPAEEQGSLQAVIEKLFEKYRVAQDKPSVRLGNLLGILLSKHINK